MRSNSVSHETELIVHINSAHKGFVILENSGADNFSLSSSPLVTTHNAVKIDTSARRQHLHHFVVPPAQCSKPGNLLVLCHFECATFDVGWSILE
ncbi:hypothetical protein F442_10768 [Phytophthora nicotianae P10297]|uniref:Uncharacterized protein n=1 Tax=Phytophthora nicotianae P10297 TaxID=1317064 RepID=W2Z5T4_PHYNI|nr:hypothetical protein F442_10768 [Phytophthora nicotianae P10297]